MTSIVLRNDYVVTVDRERRVFPNGYVHVDGERIAAVSPMDQLAPGVAGEVDEVLDVGGKLFIPGLINLHDHHLASLFKGFDEGDEMESWLVSHVIPIAMSLTPGDLRIAGPLHQPQQGHRVDPATQALVWQYGADDVPGTAPGLLDTPDGFDLLMPDGTTPTHPSTG